VWSDYRIDPKCKINSDVFAKINRIVQTCDEMEFCSSSLKWAKLNYDLKCRYSDKTDVESLKLLGAVASAYQSNDKKDEAIKTQQEVCDKYKELLGESDVETILANVTLGSIYAKNKRYNEAQPILDDCYEKLCKYVGEHNFETVEVLYKLGCANRRIENYSLAKKQLLYVYEWRRVHLGQNEEDTVFALDELAYSCLKNKDYDDSESYYVQLCDLIYDEDRKSYVVNFKDPDDVWHWDFVLADALGYLTDIYLEKKDYKNALKCQKRLKPIVDGLYMFEDNGEPQKVEAKIKEINTLMEATRGET